MGFKGPWVSPPSFGTSPAQGSRHSFPLLKSDHKSISYVPQRISHSRHLIFLSVVSFPEENQLALQGVNETVIPSRLDCRDRRSRWVMSVVDELSSHFRPRRFATSENLAHPKKAEVSYSSCQKASNNFIEYYIRRTRGPFGYNFHFQVYNLDIDLGHFWVCTS